MGQPTRAPDDRGPGRSFEDPSRPLGEELIAHSRNSVAPTVEDFRSRTAQAAAQAAADRYGVAERAKVIAVLRTADVFMRNAHPPPKTDADIAHALELAAHRVGLRYTEYRALMTNDAELIELEHQLIEDARRRWVRQG